MKIDIDRMVADIAPDAGPGLTPGARELLDEITAVPPAPLRARWSRRQITLPLAAALAAAAVLLTWLLPGSIGSRPAAALDIKRQGDYYIVTVKDLYADPRRMEAQLRGHGIGISIQTISAYSGFVGAVLTPYSAARDIVAVQEPGTCTQNSCVTGLKVRVGYRGKVDVTLGRAARPGEPRPSLRRMDMPGEPFHCVDYVNKSVDQVRSMLKRRGVTIAWFATYHWSWSSVPGWWYVHEGITLTPGRAGILANPYRHPDPPEEWYPETCPKGS